MDNNYRYDAFISYRHTEPDKFVAENLHKMLENYKLPGNVKKKIKAERGNDAKTKITRVFRDEEELPLASNLEEPIIEAIRESEWLIVICSPRLKESLWCKKEIETFSAIHGYDHILAVLVEGEPADSFPQELLERKVTYEDEEGNISTVTEKIEPLAADFRGETHKQIKKKMNSEILRLLAPIFGLSYDDLKQRQRERAIRRTIGISAGIVTASLLFGGYSLYNATMISKKNAELVEKNEQIEKQNETLTLQNEQIEAQLTEIQEKTQTINAQYDSMLVDNALFYAQEANHCWEKDEISAAVFYAYKGLTGYQGIKLPYTDECRLALFNSLNLYNETATYVAKSDCYGDGRIIKTFASPCVRQVVLMDEAYQYIFWDVEAKVITGIVPYTDPALERQAVIDNGTFAFIEDGKVSVMNLSNGEEIVTIDNVTADYIFSHEMDLCIISDDKLYVVNTYGSLNEDDWTITKAYELYGKVNRMTMVSDNLIVYSTIEKKEDDSKYTQIHLLDIQNKNGLHYDMKYGRLDNAYYENGNLYILLDEYDTQKQHTWKNGIWVVCFSVDKNQTWSVEWEQTYEDVVGKKIALITDKEGKEYLTVFTENNYLLLEKTTGNIIEHIPLGSKLISVEMINESNYVICYLEDGSQMAIDYGEDPRNIKVEFLSYRGNDIQDICIFNSELSGSGDDFPFGIVITPKNSNRSIYYSVERVKEEYELGKALERKEAQNYDKEKAREILKDADYYTAVLATGILYDDEGDFEFITGIDQSITVFDRKTKQKLSSFEAADENCLLYYYGKDAGGNRYIGSNRFGYIISPNGALLGVIEGLIGLQVEESKLVVKVYNDYYYLPIYTTENMIKMAEDYLMSEGYTWEEISE